MLVLVLFAQFSLVGAATRCVLSTSGVRVAATHDVAGHGASHGVPSAPEHQRLPGCAGTSMCLVVMLMPSSAAVDASVTASDPRIAVPASAWASVTRVPELPPPRG